MKNWHLASNKIIIAIFVIIYIPLWMSMCSQQKQYPVGIEFEPYVFRSGDNGDNWCLTWAADGDLYTSQCDGRGWLYEDGSKRNFMNNQIWRISGGPDSLSFKASVLYGAPDYSRSAQEIVYGPIEPGDAYEEFPQKDRLDTWNWYAYGIVSVDENMYQFISHVGDGEGFGWFDGSQLIWRPKGKQSWKRWNGTDANDGDKWMLNTGGNQLFFFEEPDLAFSFITIAQFGQDYSKNNDGYVYLYSPSGKYKAHLLNMARVKKEHILDRNKWEYFVSINDEGNSEWAMGEIEKRGVVHTFPEGWGFYSWSPSVIWNDKLGLFIMACAGTQKPGTGEVLESYMHYETAGLIMLWAENPWGPWNQFYCDESWNAGDPENRTYLPQISPKWISDDGRSMYLIFSDCTQGYTIHYKWNMQKFRLIFNSD